METNLTMVFAEGFIFIGRTIGDALLKDGVQLLTVLSQNGPTTVPLKIGDIKIDLSKYPTSQIPKQSQLFRDYVKITTGIDIPEPGLRTH